MNATLNGENQIEEFRRIARSLTSKIALHKNVMGIVWIGGLVRGFADRFSDVDIIVFLNKKDENLVRQIRIISSGEKTDVDVDLVIHFLEDFKARKLCEADKWEFANAKIVFDPKSEIKRVFKEKLHLSKDFWVKRIVICSEYLKWYCCPPRKNVGTISESWIERGRLLSAHHCLNYGVDLLLRLVFALNKEFLPAPKWRLFYSYQLRWLPKNYGKLVEQVISVRDFSANEFERRLTAIRKLWSGTLSKIEDETGLALEQMSEYYVQRILH